MQKSRTSSFKLNEISSISVLITSWESTECSCVTLGRTGGQVYHPDLSGRIRHGLRDDLRLGGEEVQIKQGWPKSESHLATAEGCEI